MTGAQIAIVSIIISFIGVVLVPLFVLMYRGIVKWTRVESKLDELVKDMRDIVADKEKIHGAIFTQMSEDRKATDRRLRWLEENLWKGSGRHAL